MANNQNFRVKNGLEVGLSADVGSTLSVGSNIYTKGDLIFEGATDDAFELTLSVTDPTADRTIVLPDSDGTFVLAVGGTTTTTQGDLNITHSIDSTGVLTTTGTAQGLATTDTPTFNGAIFDGSTFVGKTTANLATTGIQMFASGNIGISGTNTPLTLTRNDVADGSLISFRGPDNPSGTTNIGYIGCNSTNLTIGTTNNEVITLSGLDTQLAGNLTVQGSTTLGDAATDTITFNGIITGGTPLVFEGATANEFETSFAITDPTADRTITFPDASGTVAFTSGSDVLNISDGTTSSTLQTADTLTISGGTYLTSSVSGDTATINHDSTTRTDATSTASPGYAGTFTAVDSVTTNATGHVTAINVKTVTMPSAENYSFTATADSGTNQTIANGNTLDVAGGTYISTVVGATDTVTVNHDSTTRSDTTSTDSPAYGGTFEAVTSVTTNATGHVTAIDVSTVTIPASDNTDTTYSISAATRTGSGANLRLTAGGSGSGNDDVGFVGAGIATVSQTDANTITITATEADTLSSVLGRGNTANTNILPDSTANNRNIGSSTQVWNTVYATTFEGTATQAQYADLAEKYLADDIYGPGTVIAVGGDAEVTAAHDDFAHSVLGVVSTAPAYLMNKDLKDGTVIALKGRVPVKCIGTVKKGDRLAPSHFAGYATVDNSRNAWSFAIALEDGADDLIEAVIL